MTNENTSLKQQQQGTTKLFGKTKMNINQNKWGITTYTYHEKNQNKAKQTKCDMNKQNKVFQIERGKQSNRLNLS